jgi:hypothetical protein
MSTIIYLYGFVPAGTESPPRALSGMHGAAVSLLDLGGVDAVVSHVPADELSPAIIESGMQDLNWVGARGLEHERVVAWFVDNAEILPVSLFTLFSSEASLRSEAGERADAARTRLERLQGCREWDLKVSYDQQRLAANAAAVSDTIRAIDAEIAAAAAGRRFLLERKRADMLKHELNGAARNAAASLLETLSAHARDVVALPPPRNEGLPVVLTAALLVHRDAEEAMRTTAAEQAESLENIGIHAQLTGPWAPYRFAEAT